MFLRIFRLFLFLFLLIWKFSLSTCAQKNFRDTLPLIQLSGVVIDEESTEYLPYSTVFDKTQKRGVVSDYYGFFSIVVKPGDTLIFSNFTYATNTFIVSDTLFDSRYSIIHAMQKDTIHLPEVTVYPWPSREDFARAFVEMEPYDDALRRAQRELSGESLAFVAARLDNDASLAYGYAVNQRTTKLYTQNQMPANNLFNPYAWSKLVQDWKAGKLSRQ